MLAQGIIQTSNSLWVTAMVMATTKDGSCRFCIAYRALSNVAIKKMPTRCPCIDDILESLPGMR